MNCSLSRTARQRQRGNRSRSNTKSDCQENESFAQLLDAQSILGTLHHTRLKHIYHSWRLKGSAKEQSVLFTPLTPGTSTSGLCHTPVLNFSFALTEATLLFEDFYSPTMALIAWRRVYVCIHIISSQHLLGNFSCRSWPSTCTFLWR